MRVLQFANAIAVSRQWPAQYDENEDLQMEIETSGADGLGQRSQVVTVSMGRDRDGDAVGWIWSKVADVHQVDDPWGLLQLNAEITYGRIALRGDVVVVAHTLYDAMADEDEVGKALFWVAQIADELEQQIHGGDWN